MWTITDRKMNQPNYHSNQQNMRNKIKSFTKIILSQFLLTILMGCETMAVRMDESPISNEIKSGIEKVAVVAVYKDLGFEQLNKVLLMGACRKKDNIDVNPYNMYESLVVDYLQSIGYKAESNKDFRQHVKYTENLWAQTAKADIQYFENAGYDAIILMNPIAQAVGPLQASIGYGILSMPNPFKHSIDVMVGHDSVNVDIYKLKPKKLIAGFNIFTQVPLSRKQINYAEAQKCEVSNLTEIANYIFESSKQNLLYELKLKFR